MFFRKKKDMNTLNMFDEIKNLNKQKNYYR